MAVMRVKRNFSAFNLPPGGGWSGSLCQQVENFGDHAVADFVLNGSWNISMLHQWLPDSIVSRIMQIRPPDIFSTRPDRMVWDLETTGSFSFSSTYNLVRQDSNISIFSSNIWLSALPVKISFFMIRMLSGRLPVMESLQRRGVCGPSRCSCCVNPAVESVDHVFCAGDVPRWVWNSFQVEAGDFVHVSTVKHAVIQWWMRPAKNKLMKLLYQILPSLICWHLWKARNVAVWEGKVLSAIQVHFKDMGVGRYSWHRLHISLMGWKKEMRVTLVRCLPPASTLLKLNTDGCSLGNPGRSGGVGRCPWALQRELDELLAFRNAFHVVSHCYRQANVPADRLSKIGTDTGSTVIYNSFVQLPRLVRGDLRKKGGKVSSLQHRKMDFEEFCAAAINVHHLEEGLKPPTTQIDPSMLLLINRLAASQRITDLTVNIARKRQEVSVNCSRRGALSAVAEICQFKAISAYSRSSMLLLIVFLVSLPPALKF
ncbi:uncharacterized protein [Coffea arabica]|uniref:Reverse transcriptase zinc-binding domain-containing protein n=1 Tax=Coffea arabica TaxID=13443 RepID=A0ABM4X7J0_COFAR